MNWPSDEEQMRLLKSNPDFVTAYTLGYEDAKAGREKVVSDIATLNTKERKTGESQ